MPSSNLLPSSISKVDEHLNNVQKLAIQFYDEEAALEERGLRDELRQAAQNTSDQIMALETLIILPFAGNPCKEYHESVFAHLVIYAREEEEGRRGLEHVPEAIGRIAKDWSWQHRYGKQQYAPPPEDNELAVTTKKLEQATKKLAEKDREIASLKEELSRLRGYNFEDADQLYSTPTTVVNCMCGRDSRSIESTSEASPTPRYPHSAASSATYTEDETAKAHHPADSTTIETIRDPTEASINDDYGSQHGDEVSNEVSRPEGSSSPTPGGWYSETNEVTSLDGGSLGSIKWDQGWSGNPSWDNNAVPSWGIEGADSTELAGEAFQPGEPPKWRDSKLRPESKSWLHPLSFGNAPHTMSEARYKDILDLHVLPLATRLEDDEWLNSPLGIVRVDDLLLFRLLTRGRELAQKCLWAHMDKNRPDIRSRKFPGGWQQVKFEVCALRETLQFGSLHIRENCARLAYDAVFNVVPLRHLTCHWNPADLGWPRPAPQMVDYHLKNVQKLAIHLYDEASAMEARKLRDEARQAVEDTVNELVALEPLSDEYDWKYHHEQMFLQITFARDEKDPDMFKFPDIVFRAADAWLRRRPSEDLAYDSFTDREQKKLEDGLEEKTVKEEKTTEAEGDQRRTLARNNFITRIPSRRHSISAAYPHNPGVFSICSAYPQHITFRDI
ncbi:hypothetical protein N8I77_013367 [Diaporthe amygdali]|uniref:Uncharacterized protein n=1 Tax=Phomopsis amygdali TaxID=1214568 RepID=A0AAD9VWL9_PHOAM|nr:hypothetical protein N8I77_013367 [Diaporthe amygdali]